jgi:hypothetical protein
MALLEVVKAVIEMKLGSFMLKIRIIISHKNNGHSFPLAGSAAGCLELL